VAISSERGPRGSPLLLLHEIRPLDGVNDRRCRLEVRHAKPTTTLLYYAHFMPRGDKKHLYRLMARRGSGFSPAFAPQREKGAASA
jgi:hypothetical protein